jgi:hypothetical protein
VIVESECKFDDARPTALANPLEIISGGNLKGKMLPDDVRARQFQLGGDGVCPAQAAYGLVEISAVVHGKEKVYGSIP